MQTEETKKLIAEAAKTIYSYCRTRTYTKEDAEDLSQEIIHQLLRAKGTFESEKAFYGFMWAVAGNVYKNWCRKHSKPAPAQLDGQIPDNSPTLAERLEKQADIQLLYRELCLLGGQHRKATAMYYFDGLKVSQIAASMKISESMVKFLLFKSRKIIKEGMNMERTELSFNPRRMTLAIFSGGEGWPGCVDPTYFERNILAQNIILACYNEPCTAEEIGLQLGIAPPYLEKDLLELCEWSGVLKKSKTNRYETDIVIFTEEFIKEATAKTAAHSREIAALLSRFLDGRLADFKAIGFHTGGDDDSLLRWRLAHLILEEANLKKCHNKIDIPTKHDGHPLLLLGTEGTSYDCLYIDYHNKNGDSMVFTSFLPGAWTDKFFDWGYFWKRDDRVNIMLDIAGGKTTGFTESEAVEIAELIKLGFIKKDGDSPQLCLPVYTPAQFQQALNLTDEITDKIAEITHKINEICTDILVQHSPAAKKAEAQALGWHKKRDFAMNKPVEIMLADGTLRRTADNERATGYILLK